MSLLSTLKVNGCLATERNRQKVGERSVHWRVFCLLVKLPVWSQENSLLGLEKESVR